MGFLFVHIPSPPHGAKPHMSPKAGELLVQEIVPRIRSLAHSLTPIGCEDREELAHDATAMAAQLLLSAEARGKKVTPGNIAYYAVGLVRQGRRSTGLRKTDPMHPAAQIHGRSHMVSLDASFGNEADGEETTSLHEVLACRSEDPATAATRRLDWELLGTALDNTTREVLRCLWEGRDLTTLMSRMKRSSSSLGSDK